MKCPLCDRFYVEKPSFVNLLQENHPCNYCQTNHRLDYHEAVIPVKNGIVRYIYLSNKLALNEFKINNLVLLKGEVFETVIKKLDKHSVVIIIDSLSYADFTSWFPLIKLFKNLVFLSIEFYDLTKYFYFF